MQVRERSAQFGKIIGLHAEPVLPCGFNRELTKTRERAANRVDGPLLLDLLEGDPPGPLRLLSV